MGVVYDYDEYLGSNLAWRLVFVGLSVAVATQFIIVFAQMIISLDLITRIGYYPTPGGGLLFFNQLSLVHFPLSFGVIVFGPWLCSVLVSVCSHPTNVPQNTRWFFASAIASIMVAAIWIQWTTFILGYFSTLSSLLVDIRSIVNSLLLLMGLNFVVLVYIIMVSLMVWFRWLTW